MYQDIHILYMEAVPEKCSAGKRCFVDVLRILGGAPCVGVISMKLKGSFVEIVLLRGHPPVGFLRVCRASFLEKIFG